MVNKLLVCGILSLFCTLFLVYVINSTVETYIHNFADRLLIASQVRDKDEFRLAEANTLIGQWRLKKWLPLSLSNRFYYGGNRDFLILMITSNRRHRKIDAFDPYYLTQTSVALVKTLFFARTRFYDAVGKVNFLLCPVRHINDTDGDAFSMELKRLRRVFGPKTFIHPSQVFDGPCKFVLDMITCISLGLRQDRTSNYVVLLEDDLLVTKNFLPALNIYASRTEGGLLRLYASPPTIAHDSRIALYLSVFYFVATLPSLIAFYVICSRFYRGGVRCLVVTFLLLVVLFVLKMYGKPDPLTISPSNDLNSPATGAAVVLPKALAENLGNTDLRTVCASSNPMQSKVDLVARAALELRHGVLDVHPPVVIHIGMYSQNRGYLHDPLLFPH